MREYFCRFHPIVNLIFYVIVIGITMCMPHPVILVISLISGIIYSGVLKGIKNTFKLISIIVIPVIFITVLINTLFNHYGVTIIRYMSNGNPITLESIMYGVILGCMLAGSIVWFSSFNEIMTSDRIICIFGKILPALSLLISMTLRFVPRISKQAADISHGLSVVYPADEKSGLMCRLRHGIRTLSVLIGVCLEGSVVCADSMKARGYGCAKRSSFSLFKFGKKEVVCLGVMFICSLITTAGYYKKIIFAQFNPRVIIYGLNFNMNTMVVYVLFAIMCNIPLIVSEYNIVRLRHLRESITDCEKGNYRLWEL